MSEPIHPAGYECAHCHRLDSHEPRCPAYGQQTAVMPLVAVYSEDDVVELVRRTMVWCGHTESWASERAREIFDYLKAGAR